MASLVLSLLAGSLVGQAAAKTVTKDFNITWTTASPDGFERPVMGINNMWPLPIIYVDVNDTLVVNVHNQLGNQSTSLHWHGLYQNGSSHMDGAVGVVQCDIPPGSKYVYNFTVQQPGTYWYHSHTRGQYPDGLRGQFIVHDPEDPYKDMYDVEVPITLSDWYHDQMPPLLAEFISYTNPTGAEPVPDSALMNETQNLNITVEPGKTYFFRMANIGAFASQYFWIEGHNMTVIQVDGVYTKPMSTEMIYITAAQRYGFLVTAKNDTGKNFAMVGSMDTDLFDAFSPDLQYNVTGWLVYDDDAPRPEPALRDSFDAQLDDFYLEPFDEAGLLPEADMVVQLDLQMNNLGDGANYAFFGDITYVTPKVPTLYSALTTGSFADNAMVYGRDTNSYVLPHNAVIDIVMNNLDSGKHPIHLHGHDYQVLYRSPDNWGNWDEHNHTTFPSAPMRRDTLWVRPNGNFVIRFRADNPGIWFIHCHLEWHLASGLAATMVEAPLELQAQNLTIPESHYAACDAGGTPRAGNAAGNTVDFLNLEGQNLSPAPLPAGFTARGIVALVFSCVAAFLGMAVIAWYGAAPLSSSEMASTQRFVQRAG